MSIVRGSAVSGVNHTSSGPTPASITSAPLSSLFLEWMSRLETEQFLAQTLQTIQALDKTALQHQIVRETTAEQQHQLHHQSFADAAAAVHMDDINTVMPHGTTTTTTSPSSPNHPHSPTFINITPPALNTTAAGHNSSSPLPSPNNANPRSPMGTRSPSSSGRMLSVAAGTHAVLDPAHLQVDEVSLGLRNSPTGSGGGGSGGTSPSGRRIIAPSIEHIITSAQNTSSPPGSPLASPNSLAARNKARLNKPLNLPSSPRLTSPSPPRSPARHIASPLPLSRSPHNIRPFYFPDGVPSSPNSKRRELDVIEQIWNKKPEIVQYGMTVEELFPFTTIVCGFSSYCNSALFDRLMAFQQELRKQPSDVTAPSNLTPQQQQAQSQRIQKDTLLQYHAREIERFDLPTRFFRLLRSSNPPMPATGSTTDQTTSQPNTAASTATPYTTYFGPSGPQQQRNYLIRDDFKPIVQEIVNRHPGLEFLESTPEFQLKYAQTVIARIFYQVNKSGNEKLTLRELRQSNFLLMLALLDQEDDINKLNDFFSYEHFYVIYCKFWELDEDHDGYIDFQDLIQYDDFALTNKVVERVLTGAGRKLLSPIPGKMNYLDFVIFLISEVDKTSEVSLDYWFNVIDIDGDGIISTYEIEYFFEEQKHKIQGLSQELITFPDIMCQMIDMVHKPLLMMLQGGEPVGPGFNSANSQTYGLGRKLSSPFDGPPPQERRLKEKKHSSSGPLSTGPLTALQIAQGLNHGITTSSSSSSTSTTTSTSLVAPTFHSHHKPFQSTATHTPVQGGSIYNVQEGLFYKHDLAQSLMAPQFFNTLFNLNKFVLSEQRDPIRIKQIHDTPQLSDWDRYAISGYYRLAELPEQENAASAWADISDGGVMMMDDGDHHLDGSGGLRIVQVQQQHHLQQQQQQQQHQQQGHYMPDTAWDE